MLKSLYIKNFKNIQQLEIQPLKRVNLFWGRNNTGKSTLLEALSIYASNGDLGQLYDLLKLRGEDLYAFKSRNNITVDDEINAFLPLVSHYDKTILSDGEGIHVGESEEDAIEIGLVRIHTIRVSRNGKKMTRRLITEINKSVSENSVSNFIALQIKSKAKEFEYHVVLNGQGIQDDGFFEREKVPIGIPFQFVSSKGPQNIALDQLWSTISMSKEEEFVVKALRIIEPTIERFNILSNDREDDKKRIPYVRLAGMEKLVRLSAMGDGINRMLQIILAMINCKGGVFLLDEFENGLHFSVQEQLWRIIFDLAEQLNIQVFVTTHSNDCINSFAKVATKSDALAIRLNLNMGNRISAQHYESPQDLLFALNNSIELR